MRLLVLSQMFPCLRHPTSAIFFANLLRELARYTERIVVVTPRAYIPRGLRLLNRRWSRWYLDPGVSEENGLKIIRPHVPMLRGERYLGVNSLLMQASLSGLFGRIIGEERIGMVLGYNMIPEGIAAVGLASRFGLPSAFWAIGSDVNDFGRYNAFNRMLSRRCIGSGATIFAESRALEHTIRSLSPAPADVRTFYKGIDVSNFADLPSREEVRNRLDLSRDRRYILFAGRLIREKGVYELAEAFAGIAGGLGDVDLIMAGEETERSGLAEFLKKKGLESRVRFTGIIPYAEIAAYMKASDLLVLPTWAEGLPNVVMEAMACGLPVVATDVGGIPEILTDGVTGLSVPPREPTGLAGAIQRLLGDRRLRSLCAENARALMRESFDVRKNAAGLAGMLRETKERFVSGLRPEPRPSPGGPA